MIEFTKPTLEFTMTSEFGDKTTIVKELVGGSSLDELIPAIKDCLAGCGYAKESIDEFFEKEDK